MYPDIQLEGRRQVDSLIKSYKYWPTVFHVVFFGINIYLLLTFMDYFGLMQKWMPPYKNHWVALFAGAMAWMSIAMFEKSEDFYNSSRTYHFLKWMCLVSAGAMLAYAVFQGKGVIFCVLSTLAVFFGVGLVFLITSFALFVVIQIMFVISFWVSRPWISIGDRIKVVSYNLIMKKKFPHWKNSDGTPLIQFTKDGCRTCDRDMRFTPQKPVARARKSGSSGYSSGSRTGYAAGAVAAGAALAAGAAWAEDDREDQRYADDNSLDNSFSHDSNDDHLWVNPATGLPTTAGIGSMDVGGNMWGTDSASWGGGGYDSGHNDF